MPEIQAIIFDMDGVLVDAREWHYEALNQALALFGHQISRHEHLSTFDGLPTRVKLELLSKERGLPTALHAFISELKQSYTLKIIHNFCKPSFTHELALSRLAAGGYKLALASNAVRESVALMMRLCCLDKYFEFMISNEDIAKAKPDPEIYLTAFSRLGVPAQHCLVVEDNSNGIAAARAAGAHVMIVNEPADVTFESISRQIALLERTP